VKTPLTSALIALLLLMVARLPAAAGESPQGPAATKVQIATTHPMRYYISLPKDWSPNRKWPVLVAPSAHYGDKGRNIAIFAAERDARKAGFNALVVEDATRGIDTGGSLGKAWADMTGAGVRRIKAADIAA